MVLCVFITWNFSPCECVSADFTHWMADLHLNMSKNKWRIQLASVYVQMCMCECTLLLSLLSPALLMLSIAPIYIYMYIELFCVPHSRHCMHFISYHFILFYISESALFHCIKTDFFDFNHWNHCTCARRYKCICLFFLLICLVQRTKLLAKTCTNQHVLRYGHTIRCYASKTNRESVSLQFGWE